MNDGRGIKGDLYHQPQASAFTYTHVHPHIYKVNPTDKLCTQRGQNRAILGRAHQLSEELAPTPSHSRHKDPSQGCNTV